MPKMKTHRGAAKRLDKTATGKVTHKSAFRYHKAAAKSPKRMRQLRGRNVVAPAEQRRLSRLIPYL
ncbi:MAG: 50S ribosomal protein L35 [Symbiobacteriaceae bacterium]|nr:50S ribosomal protein L35 [Symbiobacteriaceae bacterium]